MNSSHISVENAGAPNSARRSNQGSLINKIHHQRNLTSHLSQDLNGSFSMMHAGITQGSQFNLASQQEKLEKERVDKENMRLYSKITKINESP